MGQHIAQELVFGGNTPGDLVAEPSLAEKVPCKECAGSGGTSVFAAINHGEHACTDCNGKGFNWEPIEAPVAACSPSTQSCELCNPEYGGLCKMSFDWCKQVSSLQASDATS